MAGPLTLKNNNLPTPGVVSASIKVDRSHQVPYVGGSSINGETVYIDERLPESFKDTLGRDIPVDKYLIVHEVVEKALTQRLKLPFNLAHFLATGTTTKYLDKDGVDEEEFWKIIEDQVDVCLKEYEKSKLPTDLDPIPYEGDHLENVIDALKEIETDYEYPEEIEKKSSFSPNEEVDKILKLVFDSDSSEIPKGKNHDEKTGLDYTVDPHGGIIVNLTLSPQDYKLRKNHTLTVKEVNIKRTNVLLDIRQEKGNHISHIFALQFSPQSWNKDTLFPEMAKRILHIGAFKDRNCALAYARTSTGLEI